MLLAHSQPASRSLPVPVLGVHAQREQTSKKGWHWTAASAAADIRALARLLCVQLQARILTKAHYIRNEKTTFMSCT